MTFQLDPAVEFDARVLKHLESTELAWLTTVDSKSAPQPNPIWFFWDGDVVVVLSKTGGAKSVNIERNPHVSLNFETEEDGKFVIISGQAKIVDRSAIAPETLDKLAAKYDSAMEGVYTRESYESEYGVTIRITLDKVRGW